MERRAVNPWTWQDEFGYVQANEAGSTLADVVRLNYYVTDVDAFMQAGEVYGAKLAQAGCRPASTLLPTAVR